MIDLSPNWLSQPLCCVKNARFVHPNLCLSGCFYRELLSNLRVMQLSSERTMAVRKRAMMALKSGMNALKRAIGDALGSKTLGNELPRVLGATSVRHMSSIYDTVTTLLDGKVFEANVIHPRMYPQAELVGEDYNGNKYYEIKKGVQYGRHRWVSYADIQNYSPASVPAEWHGWLHHITSEPPTKVKYLEPSYKVDAQVYKFMGHQPKGSYQHGLKKKNWKKYEAWTPPSK